MVAKLFWRSFCSSLLLSTLHLSIPTRGDQPGKKKICIKEWSVSCGSVSKSITSKVFCDVNVGRGRRWRRRNACVCGSGIRKPSVTDQEQKHQAHGPPMSYHLKPYLKRLDLMERGALSRFLASLFSYLHSGQGKYLKCWENKKMVPSHFPSGSK